MKIGVLSDSHGFLHPDAYDFFKGMIWSQIQTGFIGLLAQALIVPILIIGLRKLMVKDNIMHALHSACLTKNPS